MAAFRDRADAGRRLGEALAALRDEADILVLGLPRGGLVVAAEVAGALGAPLDALLVRKLGVPGHEELAMGAIASGGVRVVAEDVVSGLGIQDDEVARVALREEAELARRERLYRPGRPPPEVAGRTVVLVDDGLATGATMAAAVAAVRAGGPRRVVVAVPVGHPATCRALGRRADAVVCLAMPRRLGSVGEWYDSFDQVGDDECARILARHPAAPQAGSSS